MEWKYLPDPPLRQIFNNIDVSDLISCNEVCIRWNKISKDPLIWKHLFFRRIEMLDENSNREDGLSNTIDVYINWKDMCVRLINEFPSVFIPTIPKPKLIVYNPRQSLAGTNLDLLETTLVICIKTISVEYNLIFPDSNPWNLIGTVHYWANYAKVK